MPRKTTPTEPTFEAVYAELEQTIARLEAGDLALDEALTLYERGMALAKQCSAMLDRAELKIQELSGADLLEANEETELFDDEDA